MAQVTPAPPAGGIEEQYRSWPYPKVPLLASVHPQHPWQLHCDYLWDICGSGRAPQRPRIWIAGCGTFEPYVFGIANPQADITASDISPSSLRLAQRRCRWHGVRNVRLSGCDLNDESTWPEGSFDLIECYGVLMNLPDPADVLRRLGNRLTEGGVLRLMVYPEFSRTRVFQLQRFARLCGLHAGDRSHPHRLRQLARDLPGSHPLRYAFCSYADSANDEGVVDAFLHRGDRGFTGSELTRLIDEAGLEPRAWFHRPWAQPAAMAERLRLAGHDHGFVLGYIDLWQELRQNFVVCLRRRGSDTAARTAPRPHPLFVGAGTSLRRALALTRMSWLGGRVPHRTAAGDVVLKARDVRALRRAPEQLDPEQRNRLLAQGLLLGGDVPQPGSTSAPAAGTPDLRAAATGIQVGPKSPNPLFRHLFLAWELDRLHPELRLDSVQRQIETWRPFADPLEEEQVAVGLTPFGTWARHGDELTAYLDRERLPQVQSYEDLRLTRDAVALQQTRRWLEHERLPTDLGDAELRELWILRFSHDSLFLDTTT